MFPRVYGIADCIMQGFSGKNTKQKPFESTRRKEKDNFEKDRTWDGGAWAAPPGSR